MKTNRWIIGRRSVMPAWIAGIQVCRMRPETSMSAWIPALHAGMTKSVGPRIDPSFSRGLFEGDVIERKYGVNWRQVLAVGYLLENPDLRIEDFELLCPEQPDRRGMLEKGVLKAKGAARAVVYALRIKGL
jgi:hypothetical protein